MSQTYYTILTKLGAELLANATALGVPLKLTSMAVGDGNGSIPKPIATQIALVNEVRRAPLNSLSVDKNNPNQIIAEQVIPENEGGWFIHEIGLYDDKGNLIAVGNCPSTYKPKLAEGSGRTQVIRMIIVVDNIDSVALKIDPAVVLATREYVDSLITTKVPEIRKVNNKQLNADITLNADDINALPAIKTSTKKSIYKVNDFVNFNQRPKFNNFDITTIGDFEQNYGINGYQKLPSGLIIQWCSSVTNNNGELTVRLPIEFPNNIFVVIVTEANASGWSNTSAFTYGYTHSKTTRSAVTVLSRVVSKDWVSGASGRFSLIAIGN
jgi:phage-related tail fiber protein